MKKSDQALLKKLAIYLEKDDFHPQIIGEIMDVCASATILMEKKKVMHISFEVNAVPTWAACLTQKLIQFANKIGYKVNVYECYALIFDDKDTCVDVLYGDDAMIYYETGEMPAKKESKKIKPTVDDLKAQLKVAIENQAYEDASKLRDKISKMENRKNGDHNKKIK